MNDLRRLFDHMAWADDRVLRLLADEGLDPSARREASRGEAFETRLGDILLHVALHGSYHRGQVAAAVRRAGGVPVNTDYITLVREGNGG